MYYREDYRQNYGMLVTKASFWWQGVSATFSYIAIGMYQIIIRTLIHFWNWLKIKKKLSKTKFKHKSVLKRDDVCYLVSKPIAGKTLELVLKIT